MSSYGMGSYGSGEYGGKAAVSLHRWYIISRINRIRERIKIENRTIKRLQRKLYAIEHGDQQ